MARLIIYSLLLCLMAVVAYRRYAEQGLPATHLETAVQEAAIRPPAPPPDAGIRPGEQPPLATPSLPPADPPPSAAHDTALQEKYAAAARRFKENDFDAALRLFRELPREDRNVPRYIGACLLALGNYTEAAGLLEEVAGRDPADFAVRKMLAFSYHKTDDPARGLAHAEAGLSLMEDRELRQLREKLRRDHAAQKDYVGESSSHFTVLYDGYEHGSVNREVLGILEDAYAAIGRDLGYPRQRITVILYTDRDFFDTTQAPTWSGGFYDGKIRIPLRGATQNMPQLKKVLFHEYAHAAVHSIAPSVPVWVNEGLAEYYSRSYPGKLGQEIPLSSLEQSFLGLTGKSASVAYWESYSAVSYLMERYSAYRMRALLETLGRGADMHQAFRDAFGIPYRDFLAQWGRN